MSEKLHPIGPLEIKTYELTERDAARIRKRWGALKKKMDKFREDIETLQAQCQHLHLGYKLRGSTGNYDRSTDCYWAEWHCTDCDKRFQTDQDRMHFLRYPHARRVP